MAKIVITQNYKAISEMAANEIANQIKNKSDSVLIFPTGKTPTLMYEIISDKCLKGEISFKKAIAFNLDEYLGVSKNDPLSYHSFMQTNLYSKTDFCPNNCHIPNCETDDLEKECQRYDKEFEKHSPADLCILGIGQNGHIGFNEPGSDPGAMTHPVLLNKETVKINHGPSKAITLGIKNILESRKIILLADGKNKAKAIKEALTGKICKECPASYLQAHPNVTFFLDQESALEFEHYEEVATQIPANAL